MQTVILNGDANVTPSWGDNNPSRVIIDPGNFPPIPDNDWTYYYRDASRMDAGPPPPGHDYAYPNTVLPKGQTPPFPQVPPPAPPWATGQAARPMNVRPYQLAVPGQPIIPPRGETSQGQSQYQHQYPPQSQPPNPAQSQPPNPVPDPVPDPALQGDSGASSGEASLYVTPPDNPPTTENPGNPSLAPGNNEMVSGTNEFPAPAAGATDPALGPEQNPGFSFPPSDTGDPLGQGILDTIDFDLENVDFTEGFFDGDFSVPPAEPPLDPALAQTLDPTSAAQQASQPQSQPQEQPRDQSSSDVPPDLSRQLQSINYPSPDTVMNELVSQQINSQLQEPQSDVGQTEEPTEAAPVMSGGLGWIPGLSPSPPQAPQGNQTQTPQQTESDLLSAAERLQAASNTPPGQTQSPERPNKRRRTETAGASQSTEDRLERLERSNQALMNWALMQTRSHQELLDKYSKLKRERTYAWHAVGELQGVLRSLGHTSRYNWEIYRYSPQPTPQTRSREPSPSQVQSAQLDQSIESVLSSAGATLRQTTGNRPLHGLGISTDSNAPTSQPQPETVTSTIEPARQNPESPASNARRLMPPPSGIPPNRGRKAINPFPQAPDNPMLYGPSRNLTSQRRASKVAKAPSNPRPKTTRQPSRRRRPPKNSRTQAVSEAVTGTNQPASSTSQPAPAAPAAYVPEGYMPATEWMPPGTSEALTPQNPPTSQPFDFNQAVENQRAQQAAQQGVESSSSQVQNESLLAAPSPQTADTPSRNLYDAFMNSGFLDPQGSLDDQDMMDMS